MTDEKPPTTEDPPKPPAEDPPKDPPKPPAEDPPKPPDPPKHEGEEKVPEWGKDLTAKVEGLIEAIKPPMPADGEEIGDENPVRPPWHKRSLTSMFGFGE